MKKSWRQPIAVNAKLLFFIFSSFFMMAAISYAYISVAMQRQISDSVNDAIAIAEADIRTILLNAKAIILSISYAAEDMLKAGASNRQIEEYLSRTTEQMYRRDMESFGLIGVYGYVRDEFIDGTAARRGTPLPPDFRPQTRPWFDAAAYNGVEDVTYTEPYLDSSGTTVVITAVHKLSGGDGENPGILAIDLNLNVLGPRAGFSMRNDDVYNIILDNHLSIVWHPRKELIGRQMYEVSDVYKEIHRMILADAKVDSLKVPNAFGTLSVISFAKMYNGWYIGHVTPFWSHYKSIYYMLGLLAFLSLASSCLLSHILLKLYDAKTQSDEKNRSKSSFLARMSHEIRTPLNAIIGLSEMALQENPPATIASHVGNINQAGNNLLTIINDILDFSKIESGNLQILQDDYEIASVLSDTLTIISPRLRGKRFQFETKIDADLPRLLRGDAVRLRQILLNLLTNAVKYTQEGFVRFSAVAETPENGCVKLVFSVRDSGAGIKKEDLSKLFMDFVRVDLHRNSAIEGAGLGLSIARNLCRAMGGDITADSEYGKGSIFTATVRQEVIDGRPMGVLAPPTIANKTRRIEFTAPGFRILVVDDNEMNLAVAKGFLAPYGMDLEFCTSGREALELLKENTYDLIFLDHMMPDMDGMETAAAIRAMGKTFKELPIVAFTANAVAGMKETFLNSGFTDFLSKPIEAEKLRRLMERLIPAGRRRRMESVRRNEPVRDDPGLEIEGVDTARGLLMAEGDAKRYRDALRLYRKDATGRLAGLDAEGAKRDPNGFAIHVHSLKSASAGIGANGLSAKAAALEQAALARNMEAITRDIDAFRQELAVLLDSIRVALDAQAGVGTDENAGVPPPPKRLVELRAALAAEDVGTADAILAELGGLGLDVKTRNTLTAVEDLILTSEFAKAAHAIEALCHE